MALLTASTVKAWCPQASGNEDLIIEAIAMAQGLADDYTGRSLESGSRDEYYDTVDNQDVLFLTNWPVTAVTTVSDDAQATTPSTVAAADYNLDSVRGRLQYEDNFWTVGHRAVRVQYTAGYSTTTLPNGLKRALLDLVAWLIDSRGNAGVQSESVDGVSVTNEDFGGGQFAESAPFPRRIANQLDTYRRVVFG